MSEELNKCFIHGENLAHEIADISQHDKCYVMDQFILNLMDYTEQSEDECLWNDLHEEFRKLLTKYNIEVPLGIKM